MSAIGIALAGDTKSVGRFERLGEYVKRGCAKGAVEVELFGPPGGKNTIIRRSFEADGGDTSKFVVNGTASTKKAVQDAMMKLNIQVNNLCVYLAQFRVGLFAEMNPEQMLEETQKAADLTLYNRHIEMKAKAGDLKKKSESIVQSQKVFDALAAEVKNMEAERRIQQERDEAMDKVTHEQSKRTTKRAAMRVDFLIRACCSFSSRVQITHLKNLREWARHEQLEKRVHGAEEKRYERHQHTRKEE